jgi:hypothetical protein
VTFEEDGRQDGPWSALGAKAEINLGPFDSDFDPASVLGKMLLVIFDVGFSAV